MLKKKTDFNLESNNSQKKLSVTKITKDFPCIFNMSGDVFIFIKCLNLCVPVTISLERNINLNPIIRCSIGDTYLDRQNLLKIQSLSRIEKWQVIKDILSHLESIQLVKTFYSYKNPLDNKSIKKSITIKELDVYDIYFLGDATINIELEFNTMDCFIIDDLMTYDKQQHPVCYDKIFVELYVRGYNI